MNWLKDPLILFFLGGAALFILAELGDSNNISYQIEIQESDLKRLNDQWAMQMRRPATDQELTSLVDQLVKEEIYYREAKRLGLDQNDTIVRRRMVQKLTFLTEDIATAEVPGEEALKSFYQANIEEYRQPDRYSFRHHYFSSDRRADAEQDAKRSLIDSEDLGDSFMLQKEYANRSAREIGDLFGKAFAETLTSLETSDQWQGPIESAYGFHNVLVESVQESYLRPFNVVQDRVLIDLQQKTRKDANEQYFLDLKDKYSITLPGLP